MKTTEKIKKRADELLSQMTLKEKLQIIIETSPENKRLGIPKYYHGNEALHGIIRPGKFTVFPQAIALGAMFDDELLEKIADAISDESRARYNGKCADGLDEREFEGRYNGLLTFWSPDLNLARDPRWGRTAETYGEDPYLAGKNGAAFVRGLQGKDEKFLKAVATPKHFTANNEEHNRFSCNAEMSEKTLREYHLEPFRIAVKEAEPEAVMAAYNAINNVPCHENKRLLTDILRGEWGFDGYVVSDCSGIAQLWVGHKSHEEPNDAASAALNAGVDLECGGYTQYEHFYACFLEEQLKAGKVTEERINEAVRRVLIARIKAGQFEKEQPFSNITLDVIGCPKHSALSYEAAVKSMVLLKNDGILPLKKDAKILVVGNNADVCQFGDYSGKAKNKPVSPLDGIKNRAENVKHIRWDYVKASTAFTEIPAFCYTIDSGEKGIEARFYNNAYFEGLPQRRIDETVNYAWLDRYPDPLITTQEYSCIFRGNITAPKTGEYSFRLSAGGFPKCMPPELSFDGIKYNGEPIHLKKGEKLPFFIRYSKISGEPFVKLQWTIPNDNQDEMFCFEVEAAKQADTVIAVLGLGTEYESEGNDKTDLSLPEEQLTLLRKLYEVNQNIVLVVENGSAVELKEPAALSKAILEAWYPGDRGGDAMADILFGNVSPSGRLPLGFPEKTADLPPFDDYEMENGRTYMYRKIKPLYDFGFGLSYTKFEYSDIKCNSEKAQITVKNIGEYESDEVVQLYIDSAGLLNQPKYRLKGFKRIHLKPQESAVVEFPLNEESFSLFDENGIRKVFSGKYSIYIDGHLPDENSSVAQVITQLL
ncbi:MAG: glycoside hydrolase family 3 C-terminal domain-containing protein [Clostridia bacterium]|nr:glycoside hydrolase family 3 C-terminal domain-containing protein [Clostridia bacterium]